MKDIINFFKKKETKNFVIVICLTLLIGFPFLVFHITSDGYFHLMEKYTTSSSVLLSYTGRPLSDFVILFFDVLEFDIVAYQSIFNFLAIIITMISMYMFYKEVKRITNNKLVSNLLTLISIMFIYFNAFSFELYLFSVMFSISLQYLVITYSLKFINENISLRDICISVILNLLGTFIYQGMSVLYLSLAIILVGYINRNSKFSKYVFENFKVFLIYGLSMLLNIIYMKMLPFANRYDTGSDLITRIKGVLNSQALLWRDTFSIFIPYTFFAIIVILLIVAVTVILKKKNNTRINDLITLFLMLFTTIAVSLLAIITSDIILVPRAVAIISSLPGLLILYILMFRRDKENPKKVNLSFVLSVISLAFTCFLLDASTAMVSEMVELNNKDEKEIRIIYDKIKDSDVEYISFAYDSQITYTLADRYIAMDAYARAFTTLWSRTNAFNYYLGEDYVEVESTEEFNNYCSTHDWQEFNLDEQTRIRGNTIYICVY